MLFLGNYLICKCTIFIFLFYEFEWDYLQTTNFIDPLIPWNIHNPQPTALPISTLTTVISFQDYISLYTMSHYFSHYSSAYNNHQNSIYPVLLFLNGYVKVAVSNWLYKDRYQWNRKEAGIRVGTRLWMPQRQCLDHGETLLPTFYLLIHNIIGANGRFLQLLSRQ